jgi:hypothetical protein
VVRVVFRAAEKLACSEEFVLELVAKTGPLRVSRLKAAAITEMASLLIHLPISFLLYHT